jgi:hypothetical protein
MLYNKEKIKGGPIIMSKFRLGLAVLFLFLSSGLAWAGIAHAQTFSSETDASQTVNSSLYSASRTVNISGTINGDVYCVGQNVTIDATVHGDVICAGQSVTVNGHIDGSLRVVAQDLTDGATVGRSFSAVAHNAVITKNATVGSDASFAGQFFSMNGKVGRDIVARATTMNMDGTTGRNVTFSGQNLSLWSKARVHGSLNYSTPQLATISKSADVHGSVTHTTSIVRGQSARTAFAGWATSFLYLFAAMLFFGLVLVLLMPQAVSVVSQEASDHLLRSILNALGLVIIGPIAFVVLISIVVGAPLALLLVLSFILIALLSVPITAFYIGTLIMSKHEHAILTMLVGMFVLIVLWMIPFINVFAVVASYMIGSGAIILALRKYLPTPVYKVK